MQIRYIVIGMAIFAMLIFYSISAHAQNSSVANSNLTSAINSTEQFIEKVNQSGYLIFYPNLTKAYSDLNVAKNQATVNPAFSYQLLAEAKNSAQSQENSIYQYKTDSLYVLMVITISLIIVLYVLMKPIKVAKKARKS